MAGLLYAGFDYGTTANLPGLWDSASNVTLDATAGRAGGGAAFFDESLNPSLVKALTWGDTHAYHGFAFLPVGFSPLFATVVAQLTTTDAIYQLVVYGNGALAIFQGTSELCAGGPGLLSVFGNYLEWSVELDGDAVVAIRVDGLTVATGTLAVITPAEAFQSVTMSGASTSVGQWWADDIYLVDGVAASAFSFGSRVIDNAGFLGDIHVQTLLPTADFFEDTSDAGYTPWQGFPFGPPYFSLVNENPPDDGVTKVSSDQVGTPSTGTLDIYGSYQFTSPLQDEPGYGLRPEGVVPWELFAVQWIGHLQSSGGNIVAPTVREVDAEPSTDQVDIGAHLTIPATVNTFTYQGVIYDRDPLGTPDPWTFADVFLVPGLAPPRGAREFGITLIS